ncbi:MAG: hypothetical protein AB7N76_29130 [Planctomycetota bacterium]
MLPSWRAREHRGALRASLGEAACGRRRAPRCQVAPIKRAAEALGRVSKQVAKLGEQAKSHEPATR